MCDLEREIRFILSGYVSAPVLIPRARARKRTDDVKFHWPHSERIDFEPMVALHLYRIAEEAVGNAVKHARAKSITIGLAILAGRPVLEIADDGKGIGQKLKTEGMGLRNMQYRANVIGGNLTVEARKGGGTCVRCTLPLRKPNS